MTVLGAVLLLGLAGAAGADPVGVQVLAPAPGARVSGEGAWLVLRAGAPPPVDLDGTVIIPSVVEQGVYHYRLGPLDGGRGTVGLGAGEGVSLGGGSTGFHAGPGTACWECHDGGNGGCSECHVAPDGGKHRPVLAEGCVRCHRGPDRSASDIQSLCVGCHPEYAARRHGSIRHAVASDRDPLRPGRAMDCASCHDPHAPRCLSCLARGELRSWCKRCHGGP